MTTRIETAFAARLRDLVVRRGVAIESPSPVGDPKGVPLWVRRWRAAPDEGTAEAQSPGIEYSHLVLRPNRRRNPCHSQGHFQACRKRCALIRRVRAYIDLRFGVRGSFTAMLLRAYLSNA